MKNREYYYYGAEIYGTEKWEEIRKNKLEEMKKNTITSRSRTLTWSKKCHLITTDGMQLDGRC